MKIDHRGVMVGGQTYCSNCKKSITEKDLITLTAAGSVHSVCPHCKDIFEDSKYE